MGVVTADRLAELRKLNGPLERDSVVEPAADRLRDLIIDGDLRPGEKVPDDIGKEYLGIARNTQREVCRMLVHERLLVQQFNRGFFVRMPTRDDVEDVFLVRRLVELRALRGGFDTVGANRVFDAVEQGEQAKLQQDWAGVGTANMRFHRAISALLGSERVNIMMSQVLAELRLVFHAMSDARQFYEPYLPRNREIADMLVIKRDAPAAQRLLATYLDDAERQLLDVYPG
jgi:DNA-binding GntR family transcriptional regulator